MNKFHILNNHMCKIHQTLAFLIDSFKKIKRNKDFSHNDLGRYSWAGLKLEAEGKNGLALSGFGFGLTQIRGSRLPYPTSDDFLASFLSPSRGVSVADFGPLSSFSSLLVVLLSFLGVLRPKSS